MLTKEKQKIKVRLYGIDCPENRQDYGHVAKRFTADLIFGKEVYVVTKDKDKYGRTLGIAYTLPDNTCLNEALLKAGLAWHYKYFDKNVVWTNLEREARKRKVGLWQQSNAIAPWEYRRGKVLEK